MACPDCFKGFLRTDKEPVGAISSIYGLQTYISLPKSSEPTNGVIVIIPDAFGWTFTNKRLLADTYAAAGFRVYLPDFMEGVPVLLYFLDCVDRFTSKFSWWDWICKPYDLFWITYGLIPFFWTSLPRTSHPRVVKFLEKLRTAPTKDDEEQKVGVAGFCWGGKHAIMITHRHEAHLVDAVFTAHPSALALPSDIEKARIPVSIEIGDKHSWLSPEQVLDNEKTMKKLKKK